MRLVPCARGGGMMEVHINRQTNSVSKEEEASVVLKVNSVNIRNTIGRSAEAGGRAPGTHKRPQTHSYPDPASAVSNRTIEPDQSSRASIKPYTQARSQQNTLIRKHEVARKRKGERTSHLSTG